MGDFFQTPPPSRPFSAIGGGGRVDLAAMRERQHDRAQRIQWEEQGGPALAQQYEEAFAPAKEAQAEAEKAEAGSPEQLAAHGRYLQSISKGMRTMLPKLMGLSAGANPYARQAAQAGTQQLLQMYQMELQAAQQGQASRSAALQDEVSREQLADMREARAERRDLAPLRREGMEADIEANRARTAAAQAERDVRQAELERIDKPRPPTLSEKASYLAALAEAELAGQITPEQKKAGITELGLPPGLENPQMWREDLEKRRQTLMKIRESAAPEQQKRVDEELAALEKESAAALDAYLDAEKKRREDPGWWRPQVDALYSGTLGFKLRPGASESAGAAN